MGDNESNSAIPRTWFGLLLIVAWGLAPAITMILSGLLMEVNGDDGISGFFLALGMIGGPVALFAWSIWLVYPANRTTAAKVLAVFPITIVAYTVNVLLDLGACAVIAPPWRFQ